MRTVLRKALGQAEREGLIARNVAALLAAPRVVAKEGRTLTPEQARTLLAVVRGERKEALVTIMLAYGLRRGEALGLGSARLGGRDVACGAQRQADQGARPGGRPANLPGCQRTQDATLPANPVPHAPSDGATAPASRSAS